MDLIAAIKIKVSLWTGPACGPPKRKCGWKERRRGRQSVVPVARLGTVVDSWFTRRPGQAKCLLGGLTGLGLNLANQNWNKIHGQRPAAGGGRRPAADRKHKKVATRSFCTTATTEGKMEGQAVRRTGS